jgi:hypothetical protein
MYSDLLLGLLVRHSMRVRLASLAEEVPLDPIDFAALRGRSGRAPVEAPLPVALEVSEPLRRAA